MARDNSDSSPMKPGAELCGISADDVRNDSKKEIATYDAGRGATSEIGSELKSAKPIIPEPKDDSTEHTSASISSLPEGKKAPILEDHTESSHSKLDLVFGFTNDIIDKQYRSYVWNDGKVQALVTIDTGLIAGLLLIVQIFTHIEIISWCLLALSFILLLVSFLVCLVHAVPRIHSGIGNQENLRTMVGITRFSKEEYHTRVAATNLPEIVRMNCWQIAGMCKNNLRSHKLIRFGAGLTIAGVIALGMALPIIVYSDRSSRVMTPSKPQTTLTASPPVAGAPVQSSQSGRSDQKSMAPSTNNKK